MKRFGIILAVLFLLLTATAGAEDISDFRKLSISQKLTLPVYSAPSTSAWRASNGKAEASTTVTIYAIGWDGDWLLMMYGTSGGITRVGYTPRSAFKGNDPSLRDLRFEYRDASISSSCTLTDDTKKGKSTITTLYSGTKVTYLASFTDTSSNGDRIPKAYIQTTVGGQTARGFVPMSCVTLSSSKPSATPKPSVPNVPAATVQNGQNVFVGSIDGEILVAYLDHAVTEYWGDDSGGLARYVSFNADGTPQYYLVFRIDRDVSARSYDTVTKNNHTLNVFVYEAYNPTYYSWSKYYNMSSAQKNGAYFRLSLTRANTEYKNIDIAGSVDGYLYPGEYGKSPSKSRVYLTGSFQFRVGDVHPVMQAFRALNPGYHAARPNDMAYETLAGPSGGNSYSYDGSSSEPRLCYSCFGNGGCIVCGGTGRLMAVQDTMLGNGCRTCNGSGRCGACGGDGYR